MNIENKIPKPSYTNRCSLTFPYRSSTNFYFLINSKSSANRMWIHPLISRSRRCTSPRILNSSINSHWSERRNSSSITIFRRVREGQHNRSIWNIHVLALLQTRGRNEIVYSDIQPQRPLLPRKCDWIRRKSSVIKYDGWRMENGCEQQGVELLHEPDLVVLRFVWLMK